MTTPPAACKMCVDLENRRGTLELTTKFTIATECVFFFPLSMWQKSVFGLIVPTHFCDISINIL